MMEGQQFAKQAQGRRAGDGRQADRVPQALDQDHRGDTIPTTRTYLFRLSDHYLEKKAYFDLQAGSLYEKIYDAEDNNKKDHAKQLKAASRPRTMRDAKESSETGGRASTRRWSATPKFATYKRMDEALYYYAFELGELGEEPKMQAAYQRLINDFPNSPYIANAYLAFADYYFGKGEIGNAVRSTSASSRSRTARSTPTRSTSWRGVTSTRSATVDARVRQSASTTSSRPSPRTKEGRAGREANAKQLRRDARRDLVRAYVTRRQAVEGVGVLREDRQRPEARTRTTPAR